jgi:hypothetical protein
MHDAQMNSLGLISIVDGEMVGNVVGKVTRSGGGAADFVYGSSHICAGYRAKPIKVAHSYSL